MVTKAISAIEACLIQEVLESEPSFSYYAQLEKLIVVPLFRRCPFHNLSPVFNFFTIIFKLLDDFYSYH